MPWTQIHPFFGWFILHFYFHANLHSSAMFWIILWGSVFPDLPRHLFLLWHIFICDDVYFTNWGCDSQFPSNAENWAHSIPLSFILTIISYLIYCKIAKKSFKSIISDIQCCPFLPKSKKFKNEKNQTPSIMHPHSIDINKNENNVNKTKENENEKTKLLTDNIRILRVITYSSIPSLKYNDHRHSSYEYTYGHYLTCKNCWCDLQSFWLLSGYFFLSILIHSIIDIPFHNLHPHQQFEPFSKYKYSSPISYWNYDHYGYVVAPLIAVITVLLSVWIYYHKKNDWKIQGSCCYYFWVLLLLANGLWCLSEIVFAIIYAAKR